MNTVVSVVCRDSFESTTSQNKNKLRRTSSGTSVAHPIVVDDSPRIPVQSNENNPIVVADDSEASPVPPTSKKTKSTPITVESESEDEKEWASPVLGGSISTLTERRPAPTMGQTGNTIRNKVQKLLFDAMGEFDHDGEGSEGAPRFSREELAVLVEREMIHKHGYQWRCVNGKVSTTHASGLTYVCYVAVVPRTNTAVSTVHWRLI